MSGREIAVSFFCGTDRLYGIVHQPPEISECGLLLLPGRPALRSGRHRLFVMLARAWAEAGIPVMRFDYRGTGDGEGEMGTLEESAADIASAIDAFQSHVPDAQRIVLWGLCGGAADAVLYATQDARVTGLALVNPWFYDARVRTLVKLHRQGSALLDSLQRWRRSIAGAARRNESSVHAAGNAGVGVAGDETPSSSGSDPSLPLSIAAVDRAYGSYRTPDLSARLAQALEAFKGAVLIILSGEDPGAQAFRRMSSISPKWRRLLAQPRVCIHELPEANHSLRRREWREQAHRWTLEWIRKGQPQLPLA